MKKYAFALAIVATLVIALVTAGFVSAQGTTPPTPQTPGGGYGYGRGATGNGGMMGGRGMGGNGGAIKNGEVGEGILHDTMISVAAQKLGISVDDLNARLTKGETMAQIASSKGLTAEQFTALMADARIQAIDQAVKDGKLTQTQADWMKQRGGATGNGGGMMGGNGGRGMRGNGAGNANCPYFSQTTP
jgi:hypothetical protein